MTVTKSDVQWGVEDVAAHRGVKTSTVRSYLARGQVPAPDGKISGTPWWWKSTITEESRQTEPQLLRWPWAEDGDEEDHQAAALPNRGVDIEHMHVALAALGAARLVSERNPGAMARLSSQPLKRSQVRWNVTVHEMTNAIHTAAQMVARDDLGQMHEIGKASVPVLSAVWPPQSKAGVLAAQRKRAKALSRISPLSRAVLQGLGEPYQAWEPSSKQRAAGKSLLDVSVTNAGRDLLVHTFAPAAAAIAAMSPEEVSEQWKDMDAGETEPYTSLRWVSRFTKGVNAVHTFLAVVGMASFPVAMHIAWNNQDGSTGISFRTPSTSISTSGGFSKGVWVAVPLPTETPVSCGDWLAAAGTENVVPRLEEHLLRTYGAASDDGLLLSIPQIDRVPNAKSAGATVHDLVGSARAWATVQEHYRFTPGGETHTLPKDDVDYTAWWWVICRRDGVSQGPNTAWAWHADQALTTLGLPLPNV